MRPVANFILLWGNPHVCNFCGWWVELRFITSKHHKSARMASSGGGGGRNVIAYMWEEPHNLTLRILPGFGVPAMFCDGPFVGIWLRRTCAIYRQIPDFGRHVIETRNLVNKWRICDVTVSYDILA